MSNKSVKKTITQAALVAACVAVLIYVALIPSLNTSDGVLNISVIYGGVSALSLLVLVGYLVLIKQREKSFVLLFTAILIVNFGYFLLSVSDTLAFALMANRISYFGSAYLPAIMIVMIADICRLEYRKSCVGILFAISTGMFLLASSGGILDIYYKEVSIEIVDGVTHLIKKYGALHGLYSVYLFGMFGLMIAMIWQSVSMRRITNYKQAAVICAVVFANLAVWFVEQLISVDFEFLCVSYLATELFLVLMYVMLQDYELALAEMVSMEETAEQTLPPDMEELFAAFSARWSQLTATERRIVQYYAEGHDVNEVAELCFISIHTVRKHNANIYHKLAVGSRDELVLYLELFRRCDRLDDLVVN